MERLTLREANGCVLPGFENNGVNGCYDIPDAEWLEESIDRLALIEDILGDDYDLDRLRELVEADRDGRGVVLPCKVGEKVFRLGASICMWRETDHCDEYCNGYEYRDCWEGCRAVLEDKFSLDELPIFGETVFLTREAAEAALKAREQDG